MNGHVLEDYVFQMSSQAKLPKGNSFLESFGRWLSASLVTVSTANVQLPCSAQGRIRFSGTKLVSFRNHEHNVFGQQVMQLYLSYALKVQRASSV